jgi:hypothetical protein
MATISSTRSGESRRREQQPFQRRASESTNVVTERLSFEDEPRPSTSPNSPNEFDDLYDVSPPGTPQPTPSRPAPPAPVTAPVNQIPRRPVGAGAASNSAYSLCIFPHMLHVLPNHLL